MRRSIVVLSGPVAAGKTMLADALQARYGMAIFKTKDLIRREIEGTPLERTPLQKAGEQLDKRTRGRWVAAALSRDVISFDEHSSIIIDSCRIEAQIDGIRDAFGGRVVHLHITAPEAELERRYKRRRSRLKEPSTYADVKADPTEAQVGSLARSADIVINTDRCTPEDVVVRAASHLGLYGRSYSRLVDVLVGGQWGSEGKGHLASYLAPEYDVLVRVGGPNAGHKVYRKSKPITFHHLPSGTNEAMDATILLGPGAVLHPNTLLKEIAESQVPRGRLFIDPQAMIIEDRDIEVENKGLGGISSTKRGVGAATARKVLRIAAKPKVRLARDLPELRPYIEPACHVLESAFREEKRIFLEGTQGTGLSLHHADYPYVTSRDTSVAGCLAEAGIAPSRVRRIIMIVRTYPIRVSGPSGPMGAEISWAEVARRSRQDHHRLLRAERTSTTNRLRKVAEFNWALLRKTASLNGPTDIALSFTDYIAIENQLARRFEQLTDETIMFIEEIERVVAAPVSLIVTRFNTPERSIIDRRRWGTR